MLFSLTGASGAGKSTVLAHLAKVTWSEPIRCVEFDSIGVPAGADTAWRHGAIERWVRQAVEAEAAGEHMLLCGQVPQGELLAAPSADLLEGIAVCMLHCAPGTRSERLLARGEDPAAIVHHNRFADWFLGHTLDPTHMPDVIRVNSSVPMAWERWADWGRGDPRWAAEVIVTDDLSPSEVASAVVEWVNRELVTRAHR